MDTDMAMIAPYAFHKEITTLPIIVRKRYSFTVASPRQKN